MKPGRIVLALVFFVLFVVFFLILVKGWATYSYESVFPEDVNAVIQLHKPMDVPLKLLNSTVTRKFFATKKGKEALAAINQALAAGGGGGPQPTFYKEDVEGVTVFYASPPAKAPQTAPAAKKPGGTKLDFEKLKKGMAVGGAFVKDIHIALYGNPMEFNPEEPKFLAAINLGRMAAAPNKVLGGKAKPMAQWPKTEPAPMVAFAFMRNLVVVGDPEGVKRMVHVAHGTPMKGQIKKTDAAGNEVKAEVGLDTKPLGKSAVWAKAKKAWIDKTPDFRLTLLIPNLLVHFKSDESMKATLEESGKKFGLDKLVALIFSSDSGASGLKLQTTLLSEANNPLFKLLDQPEAELKWPNLLPNGFVGGAGMNAKSYSDLLTGIEEAFGVESPLAPLVKSITDILGTKDLKGFLKNITGEISVLAFATDSQVHTVYCVKTAPGIKTWFETTEKSITEETISTAEKKLEAAKTAGAEAYAAEMMARAKEALDAAKKAKEDKNLIEAVALARKSAELANAALMFLYNQAKDILEKNPIMNATDQNSKVQDVLNAANDAFNSGNYASGVENSRKALQMVKVAVSLDEAMKLIEEATNQKVPETPGSPLANAKAALTQAKASWDAGNYPVAVTQAQLAVSLAKQAVPKGAGAPEETMAPETPTSTDTTLPEIESPRVVQKMEVYSTAGVNRMDYSFIDNNTMCVASSGDIEAFLTTPRGNAFKTPNAQELFKNIPREVQGLVLADILAYLKANNMLPEDDKEISAMISSFNLMAGVYLITTPTEATYAITLPIKLFDGSTGGGVRVMAVLVLWVLKLLLYLLTILFIYMTVKMFRSKKVIP